jgi:hypothetical protein
MSDQHVGEVIDLRDAHEIAQRIERHAAQMRRAGDRGARRAEQRIAVGRGLRHELGRDHAGRTRAVVHDELLAERFRQALRERPDQYINGAAGGKAHQYAHRLGRIVLRLRSRQEQSDSRR